MKSNIAVVLGGMGVALGLVLALVALVAGAQLVQLTDAETTSTGVSRINQYVTIAGAWQAFALFAILAIAGFDDLAHGRPLSPLFGPLIATKAVLASLLLLLSVFAIDLLRHDLQPTYRFMFDSDVRLLISALYVALGLTLSWQVWIVLRGREFDRFRASFFIVATFAAAAAVIVAVQL